MDVEIRNKAEIITDHDAKDHDLNRATRILEERITIDIPEMLADTH
jgi:hypothetical protein